MRLLVIVLKINICWRMGNELCGESSSLLFIEKERIYSWVVCIFSDSEHNPIDKIRASLVNFFQGF